MCHIKSVAAAFSVLFLIACAPSYAPQHRLPPVDELATDAFGGWVRIDYAELPGDASKFDPSTGLAQEHKGKTTRRIARVVEGEFIATSSDSVLILTDDGHIAVLAHDRIQRVILELYNKSLWPYVLWTAVGTASTISHGFFMVFTVPTWIIAGTIVTAGESRRDRWEELQPPSDWWISMQKFARFPQGLPVGLDVNTLKPKLPPQPKRITN